MTNSEAVNKLIEITKSWGGTLDLVTLPEYNKTVLTLFGKRYKGWSFPPDDYHALHWESKRIIAVADEAKCGFLIHEMGHLFLNQEDPCHSQECEWEWMGWEVALAKYVGCYRLWSEHNGSYCISNPRVEDKLIMWRRATAIIKSAAVANRLQHARDIGLLDTHDNPVTRR